MIGCLFYIFLLPIYSFIIIFSFIYYLIYFGISTISYFINKIISFFTKKSYSYSRPSFKQSTITNNKLKKRKQKNWVQLPEPATFYAVENMAIYFFE